MPDKKTKTVRVRVGNVIWKVPRGFGREYRETARDDLEIAARNPGQVITMVIDLLALIGYEATREQVATWDLHRRVEAVVYARNVHARASDNPIQRHPKPRWLPDPWLGPYRGEGAFAGPSGTLIVDGPS